ncbi:MAG: ECF-type sigma factor [Luteimonas sp.]|nr:ECF-type sigma factor [Luteimonas sp.]
MAIRVDSAHRQHFVLLYQDLQRLARRELGHSPRTSLDTCALVHEAYLKLAGADVPLAGHGECLALAAKAMRHVLIDHIRARLAEKRGGGLAHVMLTTGVHADACVQFDDLIHLDQGLAALERLDPRLVNVVECHFFGGMTFDQIAAHLDISERTAQRDWRRARAFLQSCLCEART